MDVFDCAARNTLGTDIRSQTEKKLRELAFNDAIASNLLQVYDRLETNSERIDFLLSMSLMLIETKRTLIDENLKLRQESTRPAIEPAGFTETGEPIFLGSDLGLKSRPWVCFKQIPS